MSRARLPTYYISHGGGPWPYMTEQLDGMYDALAQSLRDIPRQIRGTARAILVVSGHWEEQEFTAMGTARPPMLYDYSGFPEHTYHVQYAAAGSPPLAERISFLINEAGFVAPINRQRGFDHGTFAPLAVMYPRAELPVVQLSLRATYDPSEHFAVGRSLAPLRDEGATNTHWLIARSTASSTA